MITQANQSKETNYNCILCISILMLYHFGKNRLLKESSAVKYKTTASLRNGNYYVYYSCYNLRSTLQGPAKEVNLVSIQKKFKTTFFYRSLAIFVEKLGKG